MVVVDFVLGPKAAFLNAYSVLQWMIGQAPSAGESLIARKLGALGELGIVLTANLAVGGLVTALVRIFTRP